MKALDSAELRIHRKVLCRMCDAPSECCDRGNESVRKCIVEVGKNKMTLYEMVWVV